MLLFFRVSAPSELFPFIHCRFCCISLSHFFCSTFFSAVVFCSLHFNPIVSACCMCISRKIRLKRSNSPFENVHPPKFNGKCDRIPWITALCSYDICVIQTIIIMIVIAQSFSPLRFELHLKLGIKLELQCDTKMIEQKKKRSEYKHKLSECAVALAVVVTTSQIFTVQICIWYFSQTASFLLRYSLVVTLPATE